ncbi:MAG: hypothetical protein WCK32_08850 [Chlorobiaceae bacterium]
MTNLESKKKKLELEKLYLEIQNLKASDKKIIDDNLYRLLSLTSGNEAIANICIRSREVKSE